MNQEKSKILRELPSVSDFLHSDWGVRLTGEFGGGLLKFELRRLLEEIRHGIREERIDSTPGNEEIAMKLRPGLMRLAQPLGRRAINATGIILNTNLGRAPWCDEAIASVSLAGHYSLLEIDQESGRRFRRDKILESLMRELTGCEAATVVNNNAAALILLLNTLFKAREAIISRGQLVEIGGSFRLPDIMNVSGAIMREVGATNRTHLRDYEDAINENTRGFLHVHNSNYRIRGFAGTPDIGELVALGKKRGLIVADDLGSGALVSLARYGLPKEPLVRDSIKAGVDIVCFSGDKLIGGPQAGILCGKRQIIQRIRDNPLARVCRVGKTTLTALRATLIHLINDDPERIPFYQILCRKREDLRVQAKMIMRGISGIQGIDVSVTDDLAYVGSGAIPDEGIPSKVIRVKAADANAPLSAEQKARALRQCMPSIFCRVRNDALLFDMRTVLPEEAEVLTQKLQEVFS